MNESRIVLVLGGKVVRRALVWTIAGYLLTVSFPFSSAVAFKKGRLVVVLSHSSADTSSDIGTRARTYRAFLISDRFVVSVQPRFVLNFVICIYS